MNEKQQQAKEIHVQKEKDYSSVCNGTFYISNRKVTEECKHKNECPKCMAYKEKRPDFREVRFSKVGDFRKCELYKDRFIDMNNVVLLAIYNTLYLNEASCTYAEAIKEIEDKLSNNGKKILQAVMNRVRNYQSSLIDILGDKRLYYSCFSDAMDEELSPILNKFRVSVQLKLKEHNIPNYKEISTIETAFIITDYSINNIEKIVKSVLPYNKDIVNLRGYKLTELRDLLMKLSDYEARKIEQDINLDNDLACRKVFDEFHNKFSDMKLIFNCIDKARKYEMEQSKRG